MTMFEFLVPTVFLGIAAVGILILHVTSRRLDRRIQNDRAHSHPAE